MPGKLKQKRHYWTGEELAELRRLIRCRFTRKEIAIRFGLTEKSIQGAVTRYNLLSAEEKREHASEIQRNRGKSPDHCKALSEALKRKWSEPGYRERHAETRVPFFSSEKGRIWLWDRYRDRRGYDVPEHMREEYLFLRKGKGISAQEAGRMLGLLPAQDNDNAAAVKRVRA